MVGTTDVTGQPPSRQATEWLIRLREEPDDAALRTLFDFWLAASPDHASAWAELTYVDGLIVEAVGREPARGGRRPPIRQATARMGLVAATARAGIVAAVVAVVWLAITGLPGPALRLLADYGTGTGEHRAVRLADGTIVELAAESAIDVVYGVYGRHVRLLAGEAFFDVTKDPDRPFVVEAHGVRSTVPSTSFDVRLSARETTVEVRSGLVRVDHGNATGRLLHEGEWMRVDWVTGQMEGGSQSPELTGAWRTGKLIARDRTVSEVVDALRPYFTGLIVLGGGSPGARRVTGVYDLRSPVEALNALARAHPGVSVYRYSPWVVVISAL